MVADMTGKSHSSADEALEPAIARAFAAACARVTASSAVMAVRSPRLGGSAVFAQNPGDAARPFRIASVTKVFVAAAIHRLCEQQRLRLGATLDQVADPAMVAVLRQGGYATGDITVAQLLSHTSGLFDHTAWPGYAEAIRAEPQRRWRACEQVEIAARHGQPYGRPGEVYAYSDTGFVLLGAIVQRVTGTDLGASLRGLLRLDALGMADSWWEMVEAPRGGPLLSQYLDAEDMSAFDPSFDLFGGGGMVSTVSDLNRFFQALMAGDVLRPQTLLAALVTPASAPTAATPWRTHSYLLSSMQLGNRFCLGHTGFWGTGVAVLPEAQACVSVSLNRAGAEAMTALRQMLGEIVDLLA